MGKTKIEYILVDEDSKEPVLAHSDDMCWDLFSRKDISVTSDEVSIIPLGVCFNFPRGVEAKIYSRSSTPMKYDLMIPNGLGCIDAGYKGEVSFIGVSIHERKQVYRGDKIAQIEFYKSHQVYDIDNNIITVVTKIPSSDIEFVQVKDFTDYGNDRGGGYGPTGN